MIPSSHQPGGSHAADFISSSATLPSTSLNPATNDAPLDFQLVTKHPHAAVVPEDESRQNTHRDRNHHTEKRDRNRERSDRIDSSVIATTLLPQSAVDSMQQWGMMAYPVMPMGTDPSLMSMVTMGFNQFGFLTPVDPNQLATIAPIQSLTLPNANPAKEIIHCKSCTLFPPNPTAPLPTTRERPPGCRTVFVGGLPENMTEDIIGEVFDRCGKITTIRMSKKNFCHIRYEDEAFVENAIYFSGYRIRIGSSSEPSNTGRLHVDYAQARDDLYEWECRQRQLQREMRHRERLEQERLRPPSPPSVVHYSDHEASMLAEKLKADENFQKAGQVLVTWLDRGDCSKKNAGQFYSMIQSANSHIRRLMNEKTQYEEELMKAKEQLMQRMQGIFIQFNQIEKVFVAASHQKVWDHFTKAQRKNIILWRKQAQEIKNAHLEDAINERQEDEMDLSDEDGELSPKKPRIEEFCRIDNNPSNSTLGQLNQLKEDNDSLRCQLEAYKNEVDIIKLENKQDLEEKNKQIKSLQQALQGMQQQLLQANKQKLKDEEMIITLQKDVADSSERQTFDNSEDRNSISAQDVTSTSFSIRVTEKDAKLIGFIAIFLHVHPFGASVDYIWSYLQRLDSSLTPRDVETLLLKFPSIFHQEFTGVGASLERRWTFSGFQSQGSVSGGLNL